MRKLIVAVGCLALFGAGWCFGNGQTAQHLPGGSTWKALSNSEHGLYIVGFKQGYILGLRDGTALVATKFLDKLPPLTPAAKKDMEEGAEEARRITGVLDSSAASSLEPTVSAFYGDYRNIAVCWDKAVILSAASLAGSPATEEELNAARKKGAESGCR